VNRLGILHHWLRTASIPRDLLLTVLGVLGGWGITQWYYVKALDEARADASERKRVEQLILRGIESVGTIHYARDSSGTITAVNIQLRGAAAVGANASGSL
jgi:hypothetical protein